MFQTTNQSILFYHFLHDEACRLLYRPLNKVPIDQHCIPFGIRNNYINSSKWNIAH
jgi:hypothetical protein